MSEKQTTITLIALSICVVITLMFLSNRKPLKQQYQLLCSSSSGVEVKTDDNSIDSITTLPRICYEESLKYNSSDHVSILQLSYLHLIEDRPIEAVRVIESYYNITIDNKKNIILGDILEQQQQEHRDNIICVYMQSLESLHEWIYIESLIHTIDRNHHNTLCILMLQFQYYYHHNQSYERSLELSVEIVHNYPDLFEAHLTMATSLYQLNRIHEASSAFAIAYSLFSSNNYNSYINVPKIDKYFRYFRNSHYQDFCHMLAIYGYISMQQQQQQQHQLPNLNILAEQVFTQILLKLITISEKVQTAASPMIVKSRSTVDITTTTTSNGSNDDIPLSQRTCTLVYDLAHLQYKLGMFPKAYLSVRRYLRYCSSYEGNSNATSLLDNINDALGLPQYIAPARIDTKILILDSPSIIIDNYYKDEGNVSQDGANISSIEINQPSEDFMLQNNATIQEVIVTDTDVAAIASSKEVPNQISSDELYFDDVIADTDKEAIHSAILIPDISTTDESNRPSTVVVATIDSDSVVDTMIVGNLDDDDDNIKNDEISEDILVSTTRSAMERNEIDIQNHTNNEVEKDVAIEKGVAIEVEKDVAIEVEKDVAIEKKVAIEVEKDVIIEVEKDVAIEIEKKVEKELTEQIIRQEVVLSPAELSARKGAKQYLVMAAAYTTRGDYEQTIKQLTKAIKKAPNYPDIFILRGNAYLAIGDHMKASIDYLEVYERLDLLNTTACQQLLNIAIQLTSVAGQYKEASVLFEKIISNQLVHSDEDMLVIYARTLEALHQYQSAIDMLDKYILDINKSKSKTIIQIYTSLYEKTNQILKAQQLWQAAIHQKKASWVDIGDFYFRQNDIANAIEAYEGYLNSPDYSDSTSSGASKQGDIFIANIHKKLGLLYTAIYQQQQEQERLKTVLIEIESRDINSTSIETIEKSDADSILAAENANDSAVMHIVPKNITNDTILSDHINESEFVEKIKQSLVRAKSHYEIAMNYGAYDMDIRKFYATYSGIISRALTLTSDTRPLLLLDNHTMTAHEEVDDITIETISSTILTPSNINETATNDDEINLDVQHQLLDDPTTHISTSSDTDTKSVLLLPKELGEEQHIQASSAPAVRKGFLRRSTDSTSAISSTQSESDSVAGHTPTAPTVMTTYSTNNFFRNKHRWVVRPLVSTALDLAAFTSSHQGNQELGHSAASTMKNSGSIMSKSMKSSTGMGAGDIAYNLMRDINEETTSSAGISSSSSTSFEQLMQQQEQLQEAEEEQ